jgi:hypothetical protein
MTNGEWLREHSERKGIPLRTLSDVQETIRLCKRTNADKAMANAMLKHGRITDEARAWLASEYPQVQP